MSVINTSILLACFIIGSFCLSEPLIHTDNEPPTTKPNESEQKVSELQRRKEIAENYMNSLERAKETWVDPYEMISYPLPERQKVSSEPSVESPDESLFNLNSDEKPLFSDIKGDVVGSKPSELDVLEDNDITSGGHFSKDRQQICVLDSIYISRWLKKLILKVEKESNSDPSSVSFPLDSNMLDKLKELSTAKSLEIAQLDELICSMLVQATISKKEEFDWTVVFEYTKYVMWGIGIGCVLLFFAYLLYMGCKYHPILSCFVIYCTVVVFWHWMHLYQQKIAFKQAELLNMKMPEECRKHEFGLFDHIREYFKSYFKSNNCVKFHEALLVDPMWEVSIAIAASEALTATLLQPLNVISRVLNNALKQLFDDLPWTLQVSLIVFLFLLLIMICNYSIRLPFFMGGIEPHYPVGSCIENLQPRRTLATSSKEKMLQYFQGRGSKALKIPQDTNNEGSLPDVLQNKSSKSISFSPIKGKLKKCSKDTRLGRFEAIKNFAVSEDNESGNDSDEVSSDTEKLVSQCAHHCSCFLNSDDVQYLHDDCRDCSREESRNAEKEAVQEASGYTNSSVNKNFTDDALIDKPSTSSLKRTSKNAAESG